MRLGEISLGRVAAATATDLLEDGAGTPQGELCPTKVLVVDAENLPRTVSAARPHGGRYKGIWLYVRRDGRVAGLLKLPVADNGEALTKEQLEMHVEAVHAAPRAGGSREAAVNATEPLISVIVPSTLAREDGLCRCLESLERLDYAHRELLLIDNRRCVDEAPPRWLERFGSVRVLRERRPGISAARNRGLAAAAGEILAFTDDDVTVDPGWLSALATRFASRPHEACVNGLVIPAELETPAQLRLERYYGGGGYGPALFQPVSHRLLRGARASLGRAATVGGYDDDGRLVHTFSLYAAGGLGAGANMAFRAPVLIEVGGFDERLGAGTPSRGGEDLAMFVRLARAGYSLGYEPAALVHHAHRRDDDALRRHIEGYGIGFSSLMLALVAEDPRHLGCMLATAPKAARWLGTKYVRRALDGTRRAARDAEQPREEGGEREAMATLARVELRGFTRGPAEYWRSRQLAARR